MPVVPQNNFRSLLIERLTGMSPTVGGIADFILPQSTDIPLPMAGMVRVNPNISPMASKTTDMERLMIRIARDRENIRSLKGLLSDQEYQRLMGEATKRLQSGRDDYMKWYSRNSDWLWE